MILPWQSAANAQQFGQTIAAAGQEGDAVRHRRHCTPRVTFTIPGSYVSNFGPDISTAMTALDTAIVGGVKAKYGPYGTFGLPTYAATDVVDAGDRAVCKAGKTPSRAQRAGGDQEDERAEPPILGQPISFDSNGDLVNGKFFLFKIDAKGKYQT